MHIFGNFKRKGRFLRPLELGDFYIEQPNILGGLQNIEPALEQDIQGWHVFARLYRIQNELSDCDTVLSVDAATGFSYEHTNNALRIHTEQHMKLCSITYRFQDASPYVKLMRRMFNEKLCTIKITLGQIRGSAEKLITERRRLAALVQCRPKERFQERTKKLAGIRIKLRVLENQRQDTLTKRRLLIALVNY